MPCRTCLDLERLLYSAEETDSPDVLVGLSERGLHNRSQQWEERISKQKLLLAKHQSGCVSDSDAVQQK